MKNNNKIIIAIAIVIGIIENAMQVRSENVDTIQQVKRMTDELLKIGVVISNVDDYRPLVQ